jgi:hypothetical protein
MDKRELAGTSSQGPGQATPQIHLRTRNTTMASFSLSPCPTRLFPSIQTSHTGESSLPQFSRLYPCYFLRAPAPAAAAAPLRLVRGCCCCACCCCVGRGGAEGVEGEARGESGRRGASAKEGRSSSCRHRHKRSDCKMFCNRVTSFTALASNM